MATKNSIPPKLDDTIRLRAPADLKPRLKAIAALKRTKYQYEAREALIRFVEEEEAKQTTKRKAA